MYGADQSCAGLIPAEQCVSCSWSWPHQTGTAGHIAGQWSGQRDCGFYWNTAVCVQRTWPNTHINCTKWGEEVFFFSLLSEICIVPGYSGVCIDFNLFHQLPSLPLAHSKQRSQVVRKKIYSTASVEKKKKKSGAQLNWIELKCNQRTNTVYLMFSDNRLMPRIGGRSNTWKHMRLNFSLSLSQY